jgi:hypothetical protein
LTIDFLFQVFQALGYLLLLVILTILWIRVARRSLPRSFWLLLALAWTMNLLGNIAWIIHDLLTGLPLASLSLVDFFYVSRYALLGAALWLFPLALPRRNWVWVGASMLVVHLLSWGIYFQPIMVLQKGVWTDFWGYAMYPTLDAGLIVISWLRYRAERRSAWARVAFLFACAMTCYGFANTFNLTEYAFSLSPVGIFPNLFWILTDVFVLALILGVKQNGLQPDSAG